MTKEQRWVLRVAGVSFVAAAAYPVVIWDRSIFAIMAPALPFQSFFTADGSPGGPLWVFGFALAGVWSLYNGFGRVADDNPGE